MYSRGYGWMELVQSNTKFSTKNYGLGLIIVSAIIFIGFNQSVPMNTDVSWLVHVGESWLNNGKYITDYYETNPPLAFYVYLPVHYIIDIFNIRLNLAFTLYYAFIASLSLLLINRCLQAFKSSFAVRLTSLLVLIVCFYWMPLFQLGQRDPLSSGASWS